MIKTTHFSAALTIDDVPFYTRLFQNANLYRSPHLEKLQLRSIWNRVNSWKVDDIHSFAGALYFSALHPITRINLLQFGKRVDLCHVIERARLDRNIIAGIAQNARHIIPEALLVLIVFLKAFRQVNGKFRTIFGSPVTNTVHVVRALATLMQVHNTAVFHIKTPVGRLFNRHAHIAGLEAVLLEQRGIA